MRFLRLPKRNAKHLDEETPLLRLVRYCIIILLFCGVIWGLWMNNQRRTDMLQKNAPVVGLGFFSHSDPELFAASSPALAAPTQNGPATR